MTEFIMKRLFCALLALVLCMGFASGEELTKEFTTQYFTMRLPGDWFISFDNLEESEDSWDLGYMYRYGDVTLCMYATLDYYSSWYDVSLWRGNEKDMVEYTASLLKQFEDMSPRLIETVTVGRIPFVIIEITFEDGDRGYYAETMTNGYCVGLTLYAVSAKTYKGVDVDHDTYELFVRILNSFKPIV